MRYARQIVCSNSLDGVQKGVAFTIQSPKIRSDYIEVIAVDHCNLNCFSCDHLAPISKKMELELGMMEKSLERLSTVFHARTARIIGGEPLLHPNLKNLAKTVNHTQVADTLRLVTNGTMLDRVSPDLLGELDSIEISLYPGYEIAIEDLRRWREKFYSFGVNLFVKRTSQFRLSYGEFASEDPDLINKIYSTCKKAHVWGCQSLYLNMFYKCSVAPGLDREMAENFPSGINLLEGKPDLHGTLAAYLSDKEPLDACKNCLGIVGKLVDHHQVKRSDWRSPNAKPLEEMVDYNAMNQLLGGNEIHYGCVDIPTGDFEFPIGNGMD